MWTIGTLLVVLLAVVVDSRLYQVVNMFRHGARYPLYQYYDSNSTKSQWGQLTAVGMKQHEKLGQLIRQDYIGKLKFLNQNYNQNQFQVYTTNVNRTFQSAESQLYGMYPLQGGSKLPQVDKQYHLPPYSQQTDSQQSQFTLPEGYQPIPITLNSTALPLECPMGYIQQIKNQNLRIQTFRQMNLTYYPFMKRMGQMFNFSTLNFSSMIGLYDTLLVDKYLGRPMPHEFTDQDYSNMRHLTYWYSYFRISFNLSKAFNTPVLKRVLQDFDDRINNLENKPLKWTSLSAHDTNINAMNNDLNISSADCIQEQYRKGSTNALNCYPGPQFAANIIFQLHSDDDKQFYVKLRYNGQNVFLCEKRRTTCSYAQWKERVKSIITEKAHQICFGNGDEYSTLVNEQKSLYS